MKNESGQAVLIILLTMSIALTVVLSIIASSTSDIKISTNEAQSQRALSAAESGIEQSLVANSNSSGNVNSGATYTANVSNLAQGNTTFIYPSTVSSGDEATFWFVSHGSDGTLVCNATYPCFTGRFFNLYWGNPANTNSSSATAPAIEATVYYLSTPGNYATIKVGKSIYDPNSTRRLTDSYTGSGSFYPCPCTIGSTSFAFGESLDLNGTFGSTYNVSNGPQFMSVRLLYNTAPQPIALVADSVLPSQGNIVDSTGSTGTGGSTRKVEVTKAYAGAPAVFDTAVFSSGGL